MSKKAGERVSRDWFRPASLGRPCRYSKERKPQEITKEVVGIHVLLTRSLSGDGIPRRLLRRASPVKPTSVPLRSVGEGADGVGIVDVEVHRDDSRICSSGFVQGALTSSGDDDLVAKLMK